MVVLGGRVLLGVAVVVSLQAAAAPEEDLPDLARTTCQVTSVPAGAAISVNGKPTGKVTPAGVNLWAGRASKVEVRLPGFLPAGATLEPGLHQDTAQAFTLVPAVTIRYATSPPGAMAALDGRKLGLTPGTVEVGRGPHRFTFTLDGRVPVERPLNADGVSQDLEVPLPPGATLRVKSIPSGADLHVDGRPQEQRTPARLLVEAGVKHHVTATHDGFLPATMVLEAREGDTEDATLALEAAKPERLKRCAAAAQDRERQLERGLEKLRRQLSRATAQARGKQQEELARLERELGARQAEAEFCGRPPAPPQPGPSP